MRGGVVHFFGARQPQIQDLDAVVQQGCDHGFGQAGRGGAAVMADHDPAGRQRPGKSAPDAAGDPLIQINAEAATDVIGFETGQGHRGSSEAGAGGHGLAQAGAGWICRAAFWR